MPDKVTRQGDPVLLFNLETLYTSLGMEHMTTTSFHSKSFGGAERVHGQLGMHCAPAQLQPPPTR